MRHAPSERPAVGRLTWAHRIDLPSLAPAARTSALRAAVKTLNPGSQVEINIGRLPHLVDPTWNQPEVDLTVLVATIAAAGVNVHLVGEPGALGRWHHAIHSHVEVCAPRRPTLQVVE